MTRVDSDVGADAVEIEITPAMIKAGVREFVGYDSEAMEPEDAVEQIYEAMFRQSPKIGFSGSDMMRTLENVPRRHEGLVSSLEFQQRAEHCDRRIQAMSPIRFYLKRLLWRLLGLLSGMVIRL